MPAPQSQTPLVIGTTGLTDDDHRAIDQTASSVPILQASNTSLGVNLLFSLAGQAARQLGDDFDIEISETHHRYKKDAPSGTALSLVSAVCQATGKDPQADVVLGYHGQDKPRQKGTIGVHALRMGDVVGEHTVSYAADGERVELRHLATDRDIFARGALKAAQWLIRQPPGRYSMANVLGLSPL